MWLIIGGILIFSWGYHMGKQYEKDKQKEKLLFQTELREKQIEYYQPPSAPRLEYIPNDLTSGDHGFDHFEK